jgi:hypothetical protein
MKQVFTAALLGSTLMSVPTTCSHGIEKTATTLQISHTNAGSISEIDFTTAQVLCRSTVGLSTPQSTELDITTVQTVRPIAAKVFSNALLPLTLMQQYGLQEPSSHYNLRSGENPNLIYKRARPFPEIEQLRDIPLSPLGGSTTLFGMQGIAGTRLRWPWPPPNPGYVPASERVTLWHWDVPKPLQTRWWSQTPQFGTDPYCALCLYTGIYLTQPPSDKVDPQLFYFDTQTGLRWQATIPVHQAVASLPSEAVITGHDTDVKLGITASGSRVLALVSRPDKEVSLLYVFDGSGKLLRSYLFHGYVAQQSGNTFWQLLRSPSGQTHILALRDKSSGTGDVSVLIDSEGNGLARFISDEGKPVQITVLTDKYAVGQQQRADGSFSQYIFQLP